MLNAHDRFAVPAFTPVLLNLCLISAALWLAPQMEQPIVALAWGVLLAGITQFTFQLPFLARERLLPRPRPNFRDPGVRRVLVLMVPALFAVSVTQINLMLDTMLASFLETGSISWLYYSDRLMEFPLGILGVALATVILPRLSRRQAESAPQDFSRTLDWGLRMTLVFGVPAAIGLLLLAGPMLATLFQSDVFDQYDVVMASRSLMAYALGLQAFILIKVLAPGYYARQDTRTPVKIGVIAMLVNMGLNLALHRGTVLSIGNFDGVHIGHRAILEALGGLCEPGQRTCALLFEPTPREFFAPRQAPARLMRLREKLQVLAQCGLDQVLCCASPSRSRRCRLSGSCSSCWWTDSASATCWWVRISATGGSGPARSRAFAPPVRRTASRYRSRPPSSTMASASAARG
jgi:hypothetical protein